MKQSKVKRIFSWISRLKSHSYEDHNFKHWQTEPNKMIKLLLMSKK